MGLDLHAVKFLIHAKKKGARFDHVLMLGRQSFSVSPESIGAMLESNGLPAAKFKAAGPECAFAEPLFEALGAKQVDSLDNSTFEGAKYIHDLNQPIPADWKEKFDVVWDGGTLEHVFNFPTALQSAMELLKPGGRLFIHNCANNLCGHGFYQFSPELFYRALSPQNGFQVERMIIYRVGPFGSWYQVSDPDKIRERVELITASPMVLLIEAQRTKLVPVFANTPQQSDYSVMWQTAAQVEDKPQAKANRILFPRLKALRTAWEFYRRQSLRNRKFFTPVDKD